jgi:RNA polymerase sporulation-specific sigma factor
MLDAMSPITTPASEEAMLKKYARLLRNLSYKYARYGVEFDDLYQVGSLSLVRAWRRFEEGGTAKFTTYAYACVARDMYRYINNHCFCRQQTFERSPVSMEELLVRGEQQPISVGDMIAWLPSLNQHPESVVTTLHIRRQVEKILAYCDEHLTPAESRVAHFWLGTDLTSSEIAKIVGYTDRSAVNKIIRHIRKVLLESGVTKGL